MKESVHSMKLTPIGYLPEDWDYCQLRDHLDLLTDYDANGSFADMANNVHTEIGSGYAWYVRATDLEQKTPLSEVRYADKSSYEFLKKSSLFGGEVLVAKRGEIGKVYYFEKPQNLRATLAPNLYLLKLKKTIHSHWLYYFFVSPRGQELLKSINASTSLGAIYKEDVKNLHIPLPNLDEQKRIAEALTAVDNMIATLDEAITKKRQIKEGLMQQLLTGKTRLPGFNEEWRICKLKDIAEMFSGGTPSSKEPRYYGGDIQFLSISDMTSSGKFIYTTEKTITKMGLENSSARVFPAGTLMYAMYASLGKCSISQIETAISQAILGFILSDEIDKMYLYYHFCFIEEQVKNMGQTGTQSNLSKALVEQFTIPVPILSEQKAIADTLSTIDEDIYEIELKREKYLSIKQGMMQELLTGKTRL